MPTTCPNLSRAHEAASHTLNIMLIYDDQRAYRRAVRLLANTSQADGALSDVRCRAWRIDELMTELWHERSLAEAEGADTFILSASTAEAFSPHVLKWLTLSFQKRSGRPTAVIALDENHAAPAAGVSWRDHVGLAATWAGIDFLEPAAFAESAVA